MNARIRHACILLVGLLACRLYRAPAAGADDSSAPVFHFDFKEAAGKREIADTTGKFHCDSASADFQVEKGALRIAPGARISIPSAGVPDLTRAVTVSAWILKSSTPEVTPILMRGAHPEPIQFLFEVGWRYPVFMYKNQPSQNFWKGISYDGYFGSSIKYADPSWQVSGAALVETGGTWYQVAAVFDRGDVRIYVNGALVAACKAAHQELLADDAGPFSVGMELRRRLGKVEVYNTSNMLLNDLRLYDRAQSSAQVQAIYAGDRPRYPTQSQIPPGKTQTSALAPTYAYLGPEFDPLFQRKLQLTARYEKQIPPNPFSDSPIVATLPEKNGLPQLAIDGKPQYPMAIVPATIDYGTGEYSLDTAADCVRDFAAADVNMVGIDAIPQRYWLGEGKYDWPRLDEYFQSALAANPSARILVGLPLYPPPWFAREHPDQMEQYLRGTQIKIMQMAGPLGSDLWLATSLTMIHDVVTHIEAGAYGRNVFGYLCGGGQSSEWYWPGGMDGLPGYSAPTRQSFQAFLRHKYANDRAALQSAWHDPAVAFETAAIPAPELRQSSERFAFRDPAIAQQEIDFREYLTAATVHQLAASAHAVKEACARKKLVFAYQGYAMSASGLPKLANDGLQGLGAALDNPDIDCIVDLIDYARRRGGQAGLSIGPFSASARLHGKLIWEEHDYRTHLALGAYAAEKTGSAQETISVLQRSFGMTLAENVGVWWRVFANDWYHEEDVMEAIAALKRAGDASRGVDKTPVAQVALVYDENMPYFMAGGSNDFLRQQVWGAYEDAARMGAPYDVYLLGDLKNAAMPDYRLYIFLNAYRIDAATRRVIIEKLRKNHATAVWCFAPGYVDGQSFSLDSMRALTGFQFSQKLGEQQLALQVVDKDNPITRFATTFSTYKVGPVFTVDDADAQVLGTVAAGPALAVKQLDGWRSVYSLMPLTRELLQGLCDDAGVHVYARDFDVLFANRGYVFLYTSSAGNKTVHLPVAANVREVLSGKQIGSGVSEFTESLPAGSARVYRLERP